MMAFARIHTCKIPCTSQISPLPTSLVTVRSHVPNRNYVVTTATLVSVIFCFHNSILSCFILNEIFDMLQKQKAFCGYTNLASHMQIQINKSNHSCKQGCMCELMFIHQCIQGMDCSLQCLTCLTFF